MGPQAFLLSSQPWPPPHAGPVPLQAGAIPIALYLLHPVAQTEPIPPRSIEVLSTHTKAFRDVAMSWTAQSFSLWLCLSQGSLKERNCWKLVIPGERLVLTLHWNPEEEVLKLLKKCLGDSRHELTMCGQAGNKQTNKNPTPFMWAATRCQLDLGFIFLLHII